MAVKRFHIHHHAEDRNRRIGHPAPRFAAPPARVEGDVTERPHDDPPLDGVISTRGGQPANPGIQTGEAGASAADARRA